MLVTDVSCLQITINNQSVILTALQVVTLSVKLNTSGFTIIGNKPFAAYSGNMCDAIQGDDTSDYLAVKFNC